jgi:uncharacterized protein
VAIPIYPEPLDDPIADPFWEAIRSGHLVLPRCSVCHEWQWYPDPTGTDCVDGELEWCAVRPTGVVHTRTRIHRPLLPGSDAALPYSVGLIDMDDAPGVRLAAFLADDQPAEVGDRVTAVFEHVEGHVRPVFRREAAVEPQPARQA